MTWKLRCPTICKLETQESWRCSGENWEAEGVSPGLRAEEDHPLQLGSQEETAKSPYLCLFALVRPSGNKVPPTH